MNVYTRKIKEAQEKYFNNRKERDTLARQLRFENFEVEVGKYFISELRPDPNSDVYWLRAWKNEGETS